uniref:Uncharacterized protein n=1 Tax=Tetradesmus obliquus TaxID=3088 RepID=A0A383VX14_TETOB|eukprot:jgi/Sobl393_1/19741/SZX70018.1
MLSLQRQHLTCTPSQRRVLHSSSLAPICSRHTRQHRTSRSHGHALQSGSQPLSGLNLHDSWSAAGLAASVTNVQVKPSLPMRPITTHVNILLAGSSHYLGKAPYYSADAGPVSGETAAATTNKPTRSAFEQPPVPSPQEKVTGGTTSVKQPPAGGSAQAKAATAGPPGTDAADDAADDRSSGPVDLHAVFCKDPAAWATQLPPVLLPEACREMVYKFQDSPGQGSTLEPTYHMKALLTHLLQQHLKDYNQLCGSRGMNKSLACGCLQHSTTACFYFLPPHGPSKVDLLAMSALSQHVALLPVLSLPEGLTDEQAAKLQATVRQLLQDPSAHVEGMQPIATYKLAYATDATNSGLKQPLVLRTPAPGSAQPSVLQGLVQLLSSAEVRVYGLLDDAWERYSSFCDAYEAAGKDLSAMGRQLSVRLSQHVAGPAALHMDLEQHKELTAELAALIVAIARQQDSYYNNRVPSSAQAALRDAARCAGGYWKGMPEQLQPKLLAALGKAIKKARG